MDNNNRKQNNTVSGGELFVGMNLLSKIGAVFIILGVIAFSAASGGYIPDSLRTVMIFAVGAIMLIMGEVFYKKDSRVFANALIYGGVAELFVCTVIARYGFGVPPYTALAAGVISVIIGFLLSIRYKSQGLLIVTIVMSAIPFFVVLGKEMYTGVVYYAAAHCAAAVIARRKDYMPAYIAGISCAAIETLLVLTAGRLDNYVFASVFICCCALCYSSGILLNAAEYGGELTVLETVALTVMQSFMTLYMGMFIWSGVGRTAAGIALLVLAVIYALLAVGFSLKFESRCGSATVMINFVLVSFTFSIFLIFRSMSIMYIVMHVFASVVLILGETIERKMLKNWSYVLLVIAEILFLDIVNRSLLSIIVNLVLWLGIMAYFIIRKKYSSKSFRVYTGAAFLNAGLLGMNMITVHLMTALENQEIWENGAGKVAFCMLLCASMWLVIGFTVGKLRYLESLKTTFSFIFYGIGMICLFRANFANSVGSGGIHGTRLGAAAVIVTIIVNAASVLSVMDISVQIREKEPRFAKAVGLVVSAYSLMSLTTILGTNNFVTFTSCIISIIYIVTAAVWIVIGFVRLNALLRRFGLALALLSSGKLFLFDFSGVNAMGRTLLFIGFGITLLGISFGYGVAEKRLGSGRKP